MLQTTYSQWFCQKEWLDLSRQIIKKMKYEPVILTALPDAGLTFFTRFIQELLQEQKLKHHLFVNITPQIGQISMDHFEKDLRDIMEKELKQDFKDTSVEQVFEIALSKGKDIYITINHLERLVDHPNILFLLKSLRSLNPFSIHMLIRCDIGCITKPNKYKPAAMLARANIFVLPQFDQDGILHQIKEYKKQFGWEIEEKLVKEIEMLTGGIPGLIKYTIKWVYENQDSKPTARKLIQDNSIHYKLTSIYKILKDNNLIVGGALNMGKRKLLINLGILNTKGTIRIALFEEYMRSKLATAPKDSIKKELSKQEYILLQLFKSKKGKIVTLEEISKKVWGKHAEAKYSLWSMYKILSNLKKKIKTYGFKINNHRGRGYSLVRES